MGTSQLALVNDRRKEKEAPVIKKLECIKSTKNKYGGVFSKGSVYEGVYYAKGKRVKVEDDLHSYHYISWLRPENENWAREHFIGIDEE